MIFHHHHQETAEARASRRRSNEDADIKLVTMTKELANVVDVKIASVVENIPDDMYKVSEMEPVRKSITRKLLQRYRACPVSCIAT